MRYYLPIHLDGGNRGCEAIAKGTAKLLDAPKSSLVAFSRDINLDRCLGLDGCLTLAGRRGLSLCQKVCRKLEYIAAKNDAERVDVLWKYEFKDFLDRICSDDMMLSTGGDMMCYGNNEVIYTNEYVRNRGVRTVLWGCSMGLENLTPEKNAALHKFSLVYARESLSYDFFKSIGLQNVCLFPDPAFVLQPEECVLPECLSSRKEKVIGLNISNYILGDFSLDTPFGKEIVDTLDYVFKETDCHVLLVPHVTWNDQDDRVVSKIIENRYQGTGRISTLDIRNLNYCQIRYVISKCHAFIGARTHAVISAYSMCVPSIALGYSIKSRGIAKDLGIDEQFVLDCKQAKCGALRNSIQRLIAEADVQARHLRDVMPEYAQRAYGVREIIRKQVWL